MKKLLFLSLLLVAMPLFAERRVDLLFDLEGVRRTGTNKSFAPGVRFLPTFGTGGGIGAGLNFFFSDRVSLETKIAGVQSNLQFRIIGSDNIVTVDLGHAQVYPISTVLQWHPVEKATFRPYIGVGAVHTVLRNINRNIPQSTATGVRFHDPTGLLLDGGIEWHLGRRFSLYGDARYVPIESSSSVTFPGTTARTKLSVRPLIVSTGIAYHF